MKDSGHVFVREHSVRPTENEEDGLVFVTIGSALFVLTAPEAHSLGSNLVEAAKTAKHGQTEAFRRAVGVTQ